MPPEDHFGVLERVERTGKAANAFITILRGLYRAVKEGDEELIAAAEKALPQAFARLAAEACSIIQYPGATNRKGNRHERKRR